MKFSSVNSDELLLLQNKNSTNIKKFQIEVVSLVKRNNGRVTSKAPSPTL